MPDTTAWIRLSRTCNNACVFCDDAAQLDGATVAAEDVTAAIDAAADRGATRVVLSGGEPTLSRHLTAAIRHAKARGLHVALTTNARIIQSEKVAQVLAGTGLDEIRVSLHAARRTTHEQLVRAEKAWVETKAAMKLMARTSVRVVMQTILTRPAAEELSYLMHLAMMDGIREMRVRALRPVGRAADPAMHDALKVPLDEALKLITALWFQAKEEVIQFSVEGFDGTVDDGVVMPMPIKQADISALRMVRGRVQLHHATAGFSLLDDDGLAKDLNALSDAHGGLAEVGLELAAWGTPLVDAPPCAGGRSRGGPTEEAVWGAECGTCPVRSGCAGLPSKLKRSVGALAPLPAWAGATRVAVLDAPGLLGRALADLRAALPTHGVTVVDVADAELVIGGPDAADHVGPGRRAQIVDTLTRTSLPDGVVARCHVPGRVDARRAGGSLRPVLYRPYPVPVAAFEAPPAEQGRGVVAFGEAADWSLVASMPELRVFDTLLHPCGLLGADITRDPTDEQLLAAIMGCRLVIYPYGLRHAADPDHAEQVARDLRWIAVAQAAGRPVVAVRGPGVEDQLRHDRTGLLVKRGDPAALAAAIRLALEPDRLRRLGEAARTHARLSHPDTWAREIAGGALPTNEPVLSTPQRPWPRW